jgi:hypothetical protein
MNRKSFIKTILGLPLAVVGASAVSKQTPKLQYYSSYREPHDLFTPEEIEEAGFVFVPSPSFIHQFNNPRKPIMHNYIGYGNDLNPKDPNYFPMVCKSNMYTPFFIKTYDLDVGRKRGIQSLMDYFSKKDIFKPMILNFMRENKYHYIYRVLMGNSPGIWQGKFGRLDTTYWMYPIFVRGCRLPNTKLI